MTPLCRTFMVAIHAFESLNVPLGALVVYHETINASNCIKKPERAVRRQAGTNGGIDRT
jgi:hypothetical protein